MESNRTIFVVRHPQTEWNARGVLQGHLDSPLTAKGRNDADALGRRLALAAASKPPGSSADTSAPCVCIRRPHCANGISAN
jgi:broad specificity phosphatase PhoE